RSDLRIFREGLARGDVPAWARPIRISTEDEINGNDKPLRLSIEEGNPLNFLVVCALLACRPGRMPANPGLAGFRPVRRNHAVAGRLQHVFLGCCFMDDLLREFLTETSESLDTVDNQLVKFEQEPNNARILDNIFRLVHTIKGTCGFL